jgi:hypothetical protein
MNVIKRRSTNASRLERYLGSEAQRISDAARGWHGHDPILVGVPSVRGVRVGGDGDFVGEVDAGGFASLLDRIAERTERAVRKAATRSTMGAGFSSLSDLISEATVGGKGQRLMLQKSGTTGVVAASNSLWRRGAQPAEGAAAAAAPAGAALTSATPGALPLRNAAGGDTTHVVRADTVSSVAGNTLLLYDRLFEVNKTMSSTANETVSGEPTRYQSTTPGAADFAGNNFLFFECQAALSNTAHNWTAQYTSQNGTTAKEIQTLTGNASNIITRLDHPIASSWFAPLAAGDTGIRALTRMTCSASVTGTIAAVIGRPLVFIPMPVANYMTVLDGINTAFNLERVFDNACLALLEVNKPATGATNYSGMITLVSG